MTVNDAPTTPVPKRPRSSMRSRLHSFLVFWFRLLLLGVGGGIAWLIGVAIAQFYPAPPTQELPLQEQVLQQTSQFTRRVRRLPQLWNQTPEDTSAVTQPADMPGAPSSPAPIADSPAATVPAPDLTPEQRQQLQTELDAVERELSQLRDRTANLESQLGQSQSAATLESRIQSLTQRLNPNAPEAASPSPVPSSAAAPTVPDATVIPDDRAAVASSPLFESDALMVTLPSDVLFQSGQSQLRPETQVILDSIVSDLQKYPDATIRVAAHTDNQTEADAAASRRLSFYQAQAVQQYLAAALGDRNRWVTVGYGATQPLVANDTELNRQRNRRIEIAIEPQ